MTPAETITILRQFNEWRRDFDDKIEQPDSREIGEAIDAAVEMIDRLEADEKELVEIRHGAAVANDTIKALRAKIAEMEKQKPAAWVRGRDDHRRRKLSFESPVNSSPDKLHWSPLYALPGATGEENE